MKLGLSLALLALSPGPERKAAPIDIEVRIPESEAEAIDRASSKISQDQIEKEQPRSAPEALRYQPGVFVQQSAHGQASAYLRGLTGQQTVILFDGIRLNNSTYRQGPNQYFFTVDTHSISSIEVIRGSASTRYGSDALGGAILSKALRPSYPRFSKKPWLSAQGLTRVRSGDHQWGGRAQLQGGWGRLAFIGGFGYRNVGMLRTAGPIRSPTTQALHKSPRFERDQKTQRGTGFREASGDFRLEAKLSSQLVATAALYSYRQLDAPRTDKCPPDEGRSDECLVYLEQFRDLAYFGLDFNSPTRSSPSSWIKNISLRLSLSRQHEWRQWSIDNLIPNLPGGTQHDGIDDVWSYGLSLVGSGHALELSSNWSSSLSFGVDAYLDRLSSLARQRFTDLNPPVEIRHSRGQYIDGSTYFSGGIFAQQDFHYKNRLHLSIGGRVGAAGVKSPGDPASDSTPIQRFYLPIAAHFGLSWRLSPQWRWQSNFDRGFRPPNLDDLTSRQQVGPGYQYENSELVPEKSWSLDSGTRYRSQSLELDAFVFHSFLWSPIVRAPREIDQCPSTQSGPQGCRASRTRFSLVNLDKPATVTGFELGGRWKSHFGLSVAATLNYSYGATIRPPNIGPQSGQEPKKRVPMSKIPPLNGTLVAHWEKLSWLPRGMWWAVALRFAALQRRLAVADQADIRIPIGGTPGFAVVDLRLGWRVLSLTELALVIENLADTPYRYHASSTNGPGRSITATLRVGL